MGPLGALQGLMGPGLRSWLLEAPGCRVANARAQLHIPDLEGFIVSCEPKNAVLLGALWPSSPMRST